MAQTIYTYLISTDTLNGTVAIGKLKDEIHDEGSGVNLTVDSISRLGDDLSINMSDILPDDIAGASASLLAIVNAHGSVSLSEYKKLRYNEIDYKTITLVVSGFTYDSHQFSLSANAQSNWNILKSETVEFIWPHDITTIDNNTYSLTETNVVAFWSAGKTTVEGHLGTGRALKKLIFDATNEADVDLVVDNR